MVEASRATRLLAIVISQSLEYHHSVPLQLSRPVRAAPRTADVMQHREVSRRSAQGGIGARHTRPLRPDRWPVVQMDTLAAVSRRGSRKGPLAPSFHLRTHTLPPIPILPS